MSQYIIDKDIKQQGVKASAEEAIQFAEAVFAQNMQDNPETQMTISVVSPDAKTIAALTNRRITGLFIKQEWGGRRGDDAIPVGTERFDATDAVLRLSHAELMNLKDHDESTDEVGRNHVRWDGPCEVSLVSAICEYFNVATIRYIAPEALQYAREKNQPGDVDTKVITLSVNVTVSVRGDVCSEDIMKDLNCVIQSNSPGITVNTTEIIGVS